MTASHELLDLAVDIAREAGELAARRRQAGVSIAATKSALADIVTEADREVEKLIRRRLEDVRPDDGFLGEESGAGESRSGLTWVVDPIDGTVNYAYGIPAYAVSIAVVEGVPTPEEWTALAGVVFNPVSGELFRAARGQGAWLGDRPLAVNDPISPAGALLATGFGYDPATHAGDLARLSKVMPLARDIRRMGAASLDLASVAAGRLDGYFERGLHPWDHAAGALLVQEAGGFVSGIGGGPVGRAMTIAAGRDLFDRLLDVIVE
jgi:myo-inositol-1(or 4)-monophosphatase